MAAVQALQQWTAHSAHEVAIGLAIASETPGDWRIRSLTWLYAMDDDQIPAIAYRLSLVSTLASANAGISPRPDLIAAAVGDAMRVVRGKKSPVSIAARALEFGVRKKTFCDIRGQAEASLRRAIAWALREYLRTCGREYAEAEIATVTTRRPNETQSLARAA
jgi:hypothetical protein